MRWAARTLLIAGVVAVGPTWWPGVNAQPANSNPAYRLLDLEPRATPRGTPPPRCHVRASEGGAERTVDPKEVLGSLGESLQVKCDQGARIVVGVRGVGRIPLGATTNWTTLPRPRDPSAADRKREAALEEFRAKTTLAGRPRAGCDAADALVQSPRCGASITAAQFALRWTPGPSGTFLNLEIQAGGQSITASAPAESGSLTSQRLRTFMSERQQPGAAVAVTIVARPDEGAERRIPVFLLSGADEAKWLTERRDAEALESPEREIVLAELSQRLGDYEGAYDGLSKLLPNAPSSSILLRLLADFGCLSRGKSTYERHVAALAQEDRAGMSCQAD